MSPQNPQKNIGFWATSKTRLIFSHQKEPSKKWSVKRGAQKGDIYHPKIHRDLLRVPQLQGFIPWGFPNKHNERMPQGSQGSSASQSTIIFEGLYGYICWVFRGKYQYQYVPLILQNSRLPTSQLQWTTSNAASSSPVSGVAAVGSAASQWARLAHGIDCWMGRESAQN